MHIPVELAVARTRPLALRLRNGASLAMLCRLGLVVKHLGAELALPLKAPFAGVVARLTKPHLLTLTTDVPPSRLQLLQLVVGIVESFTFGVEPLGAVGAREGKAGLGFMPAMVRYGGMVWHGMVWHGMAWHGQMMHVHTCTAVGSSHPSLDPWHLHPHDPIPRSAFRSSRRAVSLLAIRLLAAGSARPLGLKSRSIISWREAFRDRPWLGVRVRVRVRVRVIGDR